MFVRARLLLVLALMAWSSSSFARQATIADFKGSPAIRGKIAYLNIGKYYGTTNWSVHLRIVDANGGNYHCYIVSKDVQRLITLHNLIREGIKGKDLSTTTCYVEQIQPGATNFTADLDADPAAFDYGQDIL